MHITRATRSSHSLRTEAFIETRKFNWTVMKVHTVVLAYVDEHPSETQHKGLKTGQCMSFVVVPKQYL